MKNEKKVSVIVPIYNVEKYLCDCLDSILAQKHKNIEVILIDDGSTDSSSYICDRYVEIDSRIKVIHQKNNGVSRARNLGIGYMTGDYVVFIDSDDYLSNNYISHLINLIDNNRRCELALCSLLMVNENGEKIDNQRYFFKNNIFSAEDYTKYLFASDVFGYQGNLCNKIFSVELIKKYKINFDEKIYYNEDRLFICKYLTYCNFVCMSNKNYYFYRQHSLSAMGKIEKEFSYRMLTEIEAYEKMKILIKNNNQIYMHLLISEFYSAITLRKIMKNNVGHKRIDKLINSNLIKIIVSRQISLRKKLGCIKNYLNIKMIVKLSK